LTYASTPGDDLSCCRQLFGHSDRRGFLRQAITIAHSQWVGARHITGVHPVHNGQMRIWDVPPRQLCRQHLLGEHRELHGLWNILVKHGGVGGYSRHPETLRWVGKTRALFDRHDLLVAEMTRRGYRHHSPLDRGAATGAQTQDAFIDSLEEQKRLLAEKPCDCPLTEP
jgi:hypothetical protein